MIGRPDRGIERVNQGVGHDRGIRGGGEVGLQYGELRLSGRDRLRVITLLSEESAASLIPAISTLLMSMLTFMLEGTWRLAASEEDFATAALAASTAR